MISTLLLLYRCPLISIDWNFFLEYLTIDFGFSLELNINQATNAVKKYKSHR